jgi:TonB family protein
MMARRGSTPSLRRVPVFVGLSIVGHAGFYVLLATTSLGRSCGTMPNVGMETAPPSGPEQEHPDLLCLADELLMTGGRALACVGPGAARVDACAADAVDRFHLTKTACRSSRPIDVTMIEPVILNPFAERPTEEQAKVEMLQKLEEAKKPEENPDQKGQVVDIAKPEVEVRPDDSEFLSEYDSKVEKQTKAPNAGEVSRPRPPPPPTPPQQQPPQQAPKKGAGALAMRSSTGTGSKTEEEQKQPGGAPEGRPVEDKEGYGPRAGDGKNERASMPAESPGAGNGQPLPSISDLRPSDDQISRAVGGPGSIDSLKDIDDGATTQLNTKRFKYAGFFNRVKHAVAQQWHPDDAYRLRDPTGQIYGIKSRRTIVKVALQADGTVRDLLLEHPCGVDFLDDEALKALREAAPFPNPPKGLVDKTSGLITFRFEFNFEVYDAPTFKVFRYQ